MKLPIWFKPGAWGVVGGGVATAILGFSYLGWSTAASSNRQASDQAHAAVVGALVPFCVAKAQGDADPARMVKLKAETSTYSRGDLVRSAGWATMPGMSGPDQDLARACAERLITAAG